MSDAISDNFDALEHVDMDVFLDLRMQAIAESSLRPAGNLTDITDLTQFTLIVAKNNYLRLIESGFIDARG